MIEWIVLIGANVILFFVLLTASKYYQPKIIIKFDGHLSPEEKKFLLSAFWTYLISAFIQQAAVIMLFELIKDFMPLYMAVIATSFIFMILHYPNQILAFAVFGMEQFLLTLLYSAGPIIIPGMIITHSLLASCLLFMFPESVHKNFLVWFEFFKKYPKLQK